MLEIQTLLTKNKNWQDITQFRKTTASIKNTSGETIFEQEVEVGADWSDTAASIVAQKYFRGHLGDANREKSIRQMINRVVDTIANAGYDQGYFDSDNATRFTQELAYILANQYASFNSPVWFNVGWKEKPQCSACFINSVEDSMESILDLNRKEGIIFKGGSGSGVNLSPLRSRIEKLGPGGTSSGPVSFMKGFDAFAGVIKSGGSTRRAAKMVILNVDHPDIFQFIRCKADEEKKAQALIAAGYSSAFNEEGGAYDTVSYQNANNSIRVTDEFMIAVDNDSKWHLKEVTTGLAAKEVRARDILAEAAKAAWECGDPGIQYDTTINKWHTCPNTDRIHASNPCSEYMFLNDTSCNLASLNLMKFYDPDTQTLNIEQYRHVAAIIITAMDIIVDMASYPTPEIEERTKRFAPLGIGYTNLGALLMSMGLPYNSAAGRAMCAALTSILSARCYLQSSILAEIRGPFDGYKDNEEPMNNVISMHSSRNKRLLEDVKYAGTYEFMIRNLIVSAQPDWDDALINGKKNGYRNSQISVLAPTGTISFMMDATTTGIEPELALVKYKSLVGGGTIKLVNTSVKNGLKALQYSEKEIEKILSIIEEKGGLPKSAVKEEDYDVFVTSFADPVSGEYLPWKAHVDMMAAAQPFLSGAISKTVNLPESATPEDIEDVYMYAWEKELKAIAVYRDNCKGSQPLSTKEEKKQELAPATARRKLPDTRPSVTHKFSVSGHEGYLTIGFYEDGDIGEIFVTMSKQGSTFGGMMDAWATSISLNLQYGVKLEHLADKFKNSKFEPYGITNNKEIPFASSVVDYIFSYLLSLQEEKEVDESSEVDTIKTVTASGPPCFACGSIMVPSGKCHTCPNCGATGGCG